MNFTDFFGYVQSIFLWLWTVIGPMGVLYLGFLALEEMQRRGFRTTYADAILRAVGAGVDEARRVGVDPFSPVGRAAVARGGAAYLMANVGSAAKFLGIRPEDHGAKVLAQLDATSIEAKAQADALAAGPLGAALKLMTTTAASVAMPAGQPGLFDQEWRTAYNDAASKSLAGLAEGLVPKPPQLPPEPV